MQKTRCIIVDDEPDAIKLIRKYCQQIDGLEVVAEFTNSLKAMSYISTQSIDLLFLDIEMPNLSGIKLIKSLAISPKVIITTAYRKYALEGFELEVIDYLLKPITFERFLKAINKYNTFYSHKAIAYEPVKEQNDFVILKDGKKFHRVYFSDILYVEGMNEYIKVHLPDNYLTLKRSLTSLENILPVNLFVRIHRSYIVNIPYITSFTSSNVLLNKKEFPIGKSYRSKVIDIISNIQNGMKS